MPAAARSAKLGRARNQSINARSDAASGTSKLRGAWAANAGDHALRPHADGHGGCTSSAASGPLGNHASGDNADGASGHADGNHTGGGDRDETELMVCVRHQGGVHPEFSVVSCQRKEEP
jgi:hypothetical protein